MLKTTPSDQLFRGIELKLLKNYLNKNLDKSGVIFDLGCGNGQVARFLFDYQIDYGLDICQSALSSAKKNNIYKKLILGRAEEIPLDDNTVDLVFSNCTLEHIKDLKSVLNEVKRVLKPSGEFIFTVPSGFYTEYNIFTKLNIKPLTKFYGWLRNKKLNHYHIYSLKKWEKILKDYNLKIEDYYFYHNLQTISFWDLLFWFNPLFRICNYKPKLMSQRINNLTKQAKTSKSVGSTLLIKAKLHE